MEIFSLWHLVRDALLRDNGKVKEQLGNLAKTFEEIQDEESVKSIKNFMEEEEEERRRANRDVSIDLRCRIHSLPLQILLLLLPPLLT